MANRLCITDIGTCWPHLARKVATGEYLSSEHEFFPQLQKCMQAIHISQSSDMQEMLIFETGILIDALTPKPRKLDSLWNRYVSAVSSMYPLVSNM